MNSRDKGKPAIMVCLVAAVLFGLCLSGCDEPPEAPEATVDIDEKQKELRQEVDKTQAEAKERVDQAAEKIPDGDADTPDDTGSEQPDSAKQAPPEQADPEQADPE